MAMRVERVILDPTTKAPVVILKDDASDRALPIWIGAFEASAIAMALQGVVPPRPMTHDLLVAVLRGLKAEVERVVVCDLKENTYYARIHLRVDGAVREIDSRPSDAIAVAVRVGAPIFVAPHVAETAVSFEGLVDRSKSDVYREILEKFEPGDEFKYKM